jgi:hypothetical protein
MSQWAASCCDALPTNDHSQTDSQKMDQRSRRQLFAHQPTRKPGKSRACRYGIGNGCQIVETESMERCDLRRRLAIAGKQPGPHAPGSPVNNGAAAGQRGGGEARRLRAGAQSLPLRAGAGGALHPVQLAAGKGGVGLYGGGGVRVGVTGFGRPEWRLRHQRKRIGDLAVAAQMNEALSLWVCASRQRQAESDLRLAQSAPPRHPGWRRNDGGIGVSPRF